MQRVQRPCLAVTTCRDGAIAWLVVSNMCLSCFFKKIASNKWFAASYFSYGLKPRTSDGQQWQQLVVDGSLVANWSTDGKWTVEICWIKRKVPCGNCTSLACYQLCAPLQASGGRSETCQWQIDLHKTTSHLHVVTLWAWLQKVLNASMQVTER